MAEPAIKHAKRHQHPDREHRPRHRITEGRKLDTKARGLARAMCRMPDRKAEAEGDCHRDQPGNRRKAEGIANGRKQQREAVHAIGLGYQINQACNRQDKANQYRQTAGNRRTPCPDRPRMNEWMAAAGPLLVGQPSPTTAGIFDRHNQPDGKQQDCRQFGRGNRGTHGKPCAINAGGEGRDTEMLDRPEIR